MKSKLFIAILVLFAQTGHCQSIWTGKVIKVIDGDTIMVMHEGLIKRVRFYGIDCPEINQPWGKQARLFVARMIAGKEITVCPVETDRYNRVVGWVFWRHACLNRYLVKKGLAWHDRRYSDDTGLERVEIQARKTKKGLWRYANPLPPWEFRGRV